MSHNPWIPAAPSSPAVEQLTPVVAPTGATAPQPAVTPPEAAEQLPTWTPHSSSHVFVVGAHGGSGESTIAELLGGTATDHRWPSVAPQPAVLLTARTHARGLRAAQLAMRAWAAGQTPHVRLIGLVLIADAPGKLPKPLAGLAEVIGGGVPHLWHLPWVDTYRIAVDRHDPPRPIRKVLAEINTVIATTN